MFEKSIEAIKVDLATNLNKLDDCYGVKINGADNKIVFVIVTEHQTKGIVYNVGVKDIDDRGYCDIAVTGDYNSPYGNIEKLVSAMECSAYDVLPEADEEDDNYDDFDIDELTHCCPSSPMNIDYEVYFEAPDRAKVVDVLKNNRYVNVCGDGGSGVCEVHSVDVESDTLVIQWVSFSSCYDCQVYSEEFYTKSQPYRLSLFITDDIVPVNITSEEAEKQRAEFIEQDRTGGVFERYHAMKVGA